MVAPYNAQVRLIRRDLDDAGLGAVTVGTVDKFQGREAPVVFYSMATSSADDVPRSLELLISRNRLNQRSGLACGVHLGQPAAAARSRHRLKLGKRGALLARGV